VVTGAWGVVLSTRMMDGMPDLLERNGYVARALTRCCLGCWGSMNN